MQLNARPLDRSEEQDVATHEHEARVVPDQSEVIELSQKKEASKMIATKDDIVDMETQISATQKMLSATSGSLLTSLLGRLFIFYFFVATWLIRVDSHPP